MLLIKFSNRKILQKKNPVRVFNNFLVRNRNWLDCISILRPSEILRMKYQRRLNIGFALELCALERLYYGNIGFILKIHSIKC